MQFIQLYFCIFFFLNVYETKAFHQKDYEIKDLFETDPVLFQKEVEYWNISHRLSENKFSEFHFSSQTARELVLGGPNIVQQKPSDQYPVFQRVYTGLPAHNYVTVIGKFWYFGDFSSEKGVCPIFIGGDFAKRLSLEQIRPIADPSYKKINFTKDEIRFDYIQAENFNYEQSLTLSISFQINHLEKRTIGFRELTIHLSNTSDQQSGWSCHSYEGQSFFEDGNCKCPLGQGRDENLNCQDFPSNCAICSRTKPSQCASCSEEARWNGYECNTCHWGCKACTGLTEHECSACNFGYYNYGNGSCLETCEWPFRRGFVKNEQICMKPCESGQYLLKHEDKCVDECQLPFSKFIREHVPTCENPCNVRAHFLYWNGTCLPFCPLPLQHVSDKHGNQLCTNPCKSSEYLYLDRACLPNCPAPLVIKSDPGVDYCLNPCSNKVYLFSDGSCHSTCQSPLRVKIENGVKYCLSSCDLEREYILKNGSCSAECPAYLVRKIEPGIGTYCLSPCESGDYFVVMNGSCSLSCPSFFNVKIKYDVKHCLSPCLADQYYFEQNKSCLESCPYPLRERFVAGANLCVNPCSGGSDDFLYDDQSCHKSCPSPLIKRTEFGGVINYCKSPCNEGRKRKYVSIDGDCQESCEYPYTIIKNGPYQICQIDMGKSQIYQVNSMREIVKASNVISEIGGILNTLINAGDPTSIFMIPLLQMFERIKYTEITLPVNMKLILNQDNFVEGDFKKRALKSANVRSIENLQEIFDEKVLRLGFICLITGMLSMILRAITPTVNESKAVNLLQKCYFALKWNILAPALMSSIGDTVLYFFVTFSRNGVRFVSYRLLLCLLIFLPFIIFVMCKIISVSSKVKTIRERNLSLSQEELSRPDLQKWRFVFVIYKSDGLSQRLFVLIFMMRVIFVSIIIGSFSEFPQIQTLTLLIMSFGMAFYLVYTSPIQKKISFIQHVGVEIPLLLYNFILVISAVIDDVDLKNTLGQLMMILYLIAPFITAILIVVKLLSGLHYLYKPAGSNIASSGFIQLSEMRNEEEEDEDDERNEPSQIMSVNQEEEENNDSEEASIEPPDVSV